MTEQWKEIDGFPGYFVSDMGRVRSKRFPDRIMSAPIAYNGYPRVCLSDKRCHSVHRLVAIAFVPNPENKPQVNHKNGIRNDARAENLEWTTASENQKHGFEVLHRKHWAMGMTGDKNPLSMPIESSNDGEFWTRHANSREAVKDGFGTNIAHINRCCNGFRKRHGGRVWRYIEGAV